MYGACKCAGLWSRKEVTVPTWAQWHADENGRWVCKEAILDVQGLYMASGVQYHIDVTIRNPMVQRYLEGTLNASNVDGHACELVHQEKFSRYPTTDGMLCRVAAAEVLGRLGPDFLQLLEELAARAAAQDLAYCRPRVNWSASG